MNFKLLTFAYNDRAVCDYIYILHYYYYYYYHQLHQHQQPLIRFPYFTAVQLFLRTVLVSLTKLFLFTVQPTTC